MNEPQQGCFVKNEEYTGQKDEYDFYFVDKQNHCVRTLTPTGRVKIYACLLYTSFPIESYLVIFLRIHANKNCSLMRNC